MKEVFVINTNKLTEGLVVKNYRELCEIMGWKPVGGDTKVKHLKELESICKYTKDGYKFIIKEVYETPLPIMDKRGGRPTSIISDSIQLSILYALSKQTDGILEISKSKLLTAVGLINEQFNFVAYNRGLYSEYRHISEDIIDEFFDKAYSNINGYLDRALKILDNKALIKYRKDKVWIALAENGVHRSATKEEVKLVMECERKTLYEFGVQQKDQIRWSDKKRFREEVINKLEEHGITNYYEVYSINGNDEYIADEYVRLENSIHKQIVNEGIQEVVYNSFANKKQKISDTFIEVMDIMLEDEVKRLYNEHSFFNKINRLIQDTISIDGDLDKAEVYQYKLNKE